MLNITKGKIDRAQKTVIYGPEGIGKTSLAAKHPDPVIIDTESGTSHMDVRRIEKPQTWEELISIIKEVAATPGICKTLVIDTADWAEQLATTYICNKYKQNSIESFGYFVENTHEPIIDMETFQYVQDEMARRRELGALANKSLNTCCFTGKIKCPYCGYSYMHNRRTKNGWPQEYWNCGSKKKKKVGDGCPVGGTISQKALEKACCEVLGLSEFDEDAFLDKVDHIEVPEKYTLDFFLKDGQVIRKAAPNTGHRDCWTEEYRQKASSYRRKHAVTRDDITCFTTKIKCEHCGCNFRKSASGGTDGRKLTYWRCADKNGCVVKGLRDDWLRELTAEVLGIDKFDDDIFLARIDHINVRDGKILTFFFTDGHTEIREWKYGRAGHKCSEEQKEHMRQVMKEKWTPERKKAMGEKIKQIRSERYWSSKGKSKQSQQH